MIHDSCRSLQACMGPGQAGQIVVLHQPLPNLQHPQRADEASVCSVKAAATRNGRLTRHMLQESDSESAPAAMTEALFGGVLSSQVVCDDCGHKAVTLEPFYNLSLPIPSKLRGDARLVRPF